MVHDKNLTRAQLRIIADLAAAASNSYAKPIVVRAMQKTCESLQARGIIVINRRILGRGVADLPEFEVEFTLHAIAYYGFTPPPLDADADLAAAESELESYAESVPMPLAKLQIYVDIRKPSLIIVHHDRYPYADVSDNLLLLASSPDADVYLVRKPPHMAWSNRSEQIWHAVLVAFDSADLPIAHLRDLTSTDN